MDNFFPRYLISVSVIFFSFILPSDALRVVKDKKYGAKNVDEVGGWDGMVGEIVRRVSVLKTLIFQPHE